MPDPLPYHYRYPRPSVTTDCVIFGFDAEGLKLLLIERANDPFKGRWAFPGGFLNMDEPAEQGALRELEEETGLTGIRVHQLHTFSSPQRDPRGRVITIAHYALVPLQQAKAADDAAKAQWFALNGIPPLAFDHDRILRMAIHRMERHASCMHRTFTHAPLCSLTPTELQQLFHWLQERKEE